MVFIILSAALIYFPLALNRYLGVSRLYVAFLITVLVGGPHMYSTFTRTLLEKNFVRRHKRIMLITLLIPVFVVTLGLNSFILLLTFFFFWASIHVLHQIIYLVDCYNHKVSEQLSLKNRLIDYAVVMTSLYPIAFYRMVQGTFTIGQRKLMVPEFVLGDWLWITASVAYGVSLILFTAKTIKEWRQGTIIWPKVLLIYITAVAAFLVPTFHDLDVAFQGLNTWHSFQYLGLTWYINKLRRERREISSSLVDRISSSPLGFYGMMVLVTLMAGLIIVFLWKVVGLEYEQCYYITVLSFLLMHYLHDHILFTDTDVLIGRPV
ncbi:MAG: hypothetical protein D6715_08085 [Calditrichaeota bacterium]|nr:MAG: hypothetical protein D6715_08085 [Calditrichota bacterium]